MITGGTELDIHGRCSVGLKVASLPSWNAVIKVRKHEDIHYIKVKADPHHGAAILTSVSPLVCGRWC